MATAIEPATTASGSQVLPIALPLGAMTAVWLTTAGHTANFREMDAARGWITTEGYSFHTALLLAIALSLLMAPAIASRVSARTQVLLGLVSLAIGSAINGFLLHAPLTVLASGRIFAGAGVGQVLFAGPRLLPARRGTTYDWMAIVMPALGPLVIAGVSQLYGWSSWEGGFLFEGVLALLGMSCIVAIPPGPESPSPSVGAIAHWLSLIPAAIGLCYVLHWGQLSGWFEDRRIVAAGFVGALSGIAGIWLAWPGLDPLTLRDGALRLALVLYAGMVQFFNVSEMGAYGGLLINLGPWQRAWLIWSVSLGSAGALVIGRCFFSQRSPGRAGAIVGLLSLAAGMWLGHRTTLDWPFWSILNTVEFNWFAAPQQWQLAPARLLMGFGTGFILLSELARSSPVPEREARIRPLLQAAQFVGGAIGIGFLATSLLVGHQLEYTFTSDQGTIQAFEVTERQARLQQTLAAGGETESARQAQVLLFRGVNYQADNLLFARIYGIFMVTSLILAALTAALALLAWSDSVPTARESRHASR